MASTRRSLRLSAQAQAKTSPTPASQEKRKRVDKETAAPATPAKKPRVRPAAVAAPDTPTPNAAPTLAQAAPETPTARNTAIVRLADPTATNATLLSPETSRIVASRLVHNASPSGASPCLAAKTTTQTLLQEACQHLIDMDARLRPLIEKNHCRIFSPEGLAEKIDPFESLASGIISQQVSGAAAKSIKAKFVALFNHERQSLDEETKPALQRFPHPSEVAPCSIDKLRTAGLSQRKAEYIQGLAAKFSSGELSAQLLHDAPYEQLVERLLAVRGLGRWSVDMFACFGLKRMDVFSVGDLGVQRGMAAFVGKDVARLKAKRGKWKYMTEQEMLDISAKFAPYRSLFMWLMWRVEDTATDISTLE
ncbi:hypothetical protein CDD82_1583 [Ophiocordyceps australis]|uniref:HhH-GPD domain-containing protein n=1 Tax=Ophiocordyceps australis TaxID=1399860 RepID=A0A2C5ZFD7_9HYPO|nr:hypothetical protein CDD82_1583 [Ophiocordyceps australis]